MGEAFKALTDTLNRRGKEELLKHGLFKQNNKEAADELRQTSNLNATDYDIALANGIDKKLTNLTKGIAVGELEQPLKNVIDIAAKHLSQNAEYNKDKGEALKYLVQKMRAQPGEILCTVDNVIKTFSEASNDLEAAKGFDTDHDNPVLAQNIYEALDKLTRDCSPEMKEEMKRTLDLTSKYLAQKAADDAERGPAFEKMIETLKKKGGEPFLPEVPGLNTNFDVAKVLKNAPGLKSIKPNPERVKDMMAALHKAVDKATPSFMKKETDEVIKKCAEYLSGYERDRGPAKEKLMQMLNDGKNKEAAKIKDVIKTYGDCATELETAAALPLKEIAKGTEQKFTKDMGNTVPAELKPAMKGVIKDAAGNTAQTVALKSGVAGDRYPRNIVAAVAESKGDEQLVKIGPYGMTNAEAASIIRSAGPLDKADPEDAALTQNIADSLNKSIDGKVSPETAALLKPTVDEIANHLAKKGADTAEVLQALTNLMMTKKDDLLANIQGAPVTYADAVNKILNAPSLANDKVDKGAYETVRIKLKDLSKNLPSEEKAKMENIMPEVIDDVAKFLAKYTPETEEEKQALLQNLMKAKRLEILDEEGPYKMTYSDAAKEMAYTPDDAARSPPIDQNKKDMIKDKINKTIGNYDKKLLAELQPEISRHAQHLADTMVGRGEALREICDKLEKNASIPMAKYGNAEMTQGEAAALIKNAKNFSERPKPAELSDKVLHAIDNLKLEPKTTTGEKHLPDTKQIVADFIAAETGKKGGFVPSPPTEKLQTGGTGAMGPGGRGPPVDANGKVLKPGEGPGHYTADGKWIPDGGGGYFDKTGTWVPDATIAGERGPPVGPDGKVLKPGGGPGCYTTDGKWIPESGGGYFDKNGTWVPDAISTGESAPPVGPDGKVLKPGEGPGHYTADGKWVPESGGGYFDKKGTWIPDATTAGGNALPVGPDGKVLKPREGPGHYTADGKWIPESGGGYFDKKGTWIPDATTAGGNALPVGPDGKMLKPGEGPGHYTADGKWIPESGGGYFDKKGTWIPDTTTAEGSAPPVGPNGKVLKPGEGPGHYTTDGKWIPESGGGYFDEKGTWIPDATTAGGSAPSVGPDGKVLKPGEGQGHYTADGKWIPESGGGYFDKKGTWIPDATTAGGSAPPAGPDGKVLKPGEGPGHYTADGKWIPESGGGYFDKKGTWIPDATTAGGSAPPVSPDGIVLKPGEGPGHYTADGKWIPESGGGYFDKKGTWISNATTAGGSAPPVGPDGKVLKPGEGPGHYTADGKWIPESGGGYFDKKGTWIPDATTAGGSAPPAGPGGKGLKPGEGSGHYTADGKWIPESGGGYFDKKGTWIPDATTAGGSAAPVGPDGKVQKPGEGPGHYTADGKWIPESGGGYFDKKGTWIPDATIVGGSAPTVGSDGKVLKPGDGPGCYTPDGKWIPESGGGYFDKNGTWVPDATIAGGSAPPVGSDGKVLKPGDGPGRTADGKWIPESGGGYFDKNGTWVSDATIAGGSAPPVGSDGKMLKPGDGPGRYTADGKWIPESGGGYFDKNGTWVPDATKAGPPIGRDGKALKPGEGPGLYTADGKWIPEGGGGYFDKNGKWVPDGGSDRRRAEAGKRGLIPDEELEEAKKILINELRKRGAEPFHKQGQTNLLHDEAANVLAKGVDEVDKMVRDSAETEKLARKFERKLGAVVDAATPAHVRDAMTDVVVETARELAEYFVSKGLSAAAKEALIDEMQKKGDALLVQKDGEPETFFYAAQRLKRASSLTATEPHAKTAREIGRQLEEAIENRGLPRKFSNTMKEHIKDASEYLSQHVTKREPEIDALVDLLNEMESAGDEMLVEGKIPKSYKNAAAYLKALTSNDDKINKPNAALQAEIDSKMKKLMSSAPPNTHYTPEVMNKVIAHQAVLLTSYLTAQGEKTDALKKLVEAMEKNSEMMILRHGIVRKPYSEAIDLLEGKNTDEMQEAKNPDPTVARKLEIKLRNLIKSNNLESPIMNDVLDAVTNYLGVHLLLPKTVKVCKCMKSAFVQCELWCEDMLRQVATRPSCTCSRTQLLTEESTRMPAVKLIMKECPSLAMQSSKKTLPPCPGIKPETVCPSVFIGRAWTAPSKNPPPTYYVFTEPQCEPLHHSTSPEKSSPSRSPILARRVSPQHISIPAPPRPSRPTFRTSPTHLRPRSILSNFKPMAQREMNHSVLEESSREELEELSTSRNYNCVHSMLTMKGRKNRSPFSQTSDINTAFTSEDQQRVPTSLIHRGSAVQRHQPPEHDHPCPDRNESSVVTTDQMSDLYAMMVSLMSNVQAWRNWMQDILNRAIISHDIDQSDTPEKGYQKWLAFKKIATMEALQWWQYSVFSKQLTLRLKARYRDKEILSPIRATVKTKSYTECQEEMLNIINMFNKWTFWLIAVLKETENIGLKSSPSCNAPVHILCWNHFKERVESALQDWVKYNAHLSICWPSKYKKIISAWKHEGPVWVVSACGAVPSGAVTAGYYFGEEIWVARTIHDGDVVPAALIPSKHCCLVYAESLVHKYNKYQVLCSAQAHWIPWCVNGRAHVAENALCVSPGVYAGRVMDENQHLVGAVTAPDYLCRVVLFGRKYSFDCFELLVQTPDLHPKPSPPVHDD